ncbi:ribosome hibernation-promoting factor, HPF/YfiA family [Thermicanus aegyptius]|uniref:ribosome hibernation-promoting factor, HPF/YfiA family n=1 Tax=Thermicanus aegyptius TaxID=94009 RepID=UPI0003F93F41|nr:ribosome-associated translation inhibitor RaiA [Thermicanus aegyptius]
MDFLIRGENIEVTPALKDYVEKRMSKLDKYFEYDRDIEATVTLKVYKDGHRVEVTIPLTGLLLRAEDKSEDMYASIDNVVDKLERQVRKYKTRVNRKLRESDGLKGAIYINGNGKTENPDEEEELEIVRTKRFNLKPMDAEEAILQMNLLGHNFFVFQNVDTNEVSVVYKRKDGRYGLIEPEA